MNDSTECLNQECLRARQQLLL